MSAPLVNIDGLTAKCPWCLLGRRTCRSHRLLQLQLTVSVLPIRAKVAEVRENVRRNV